MNSRFWNSTSLSIKICGVRSVDTALEISSLGIHAIGFHLFKGRISIDLLNNITDICQCLPDDFTKVLLTNVSNPNQIIHFLEMTGADTLQLQSSISNESLKFIKDSISYLKIIKTLSAENSIILNQDLINFYRKFVDAFLIDSSCDGGTGLVFNPQIALDIMSYLDKPIILAGGLNSKNIYDILQIINPFGIDLESGVEGQVKFGRVTRKYTSILKIVEFISEVNRSQ